MVTQQPDMIGEREQQDQKYGQRYELGKDRFVRLDDNIGCGREDAGILLVMCMPAFVRDQMQVENMRVSSRLSIVQMVQVIVCRHEYGQQ